MKIQDKRQAIVSEQSELHSILWYLQYKVYLSEEPFYQYQIQSNVDYEQILMILCNLALRNHRFSQNQSISPRNSTKLSIDLQRCSNQKSSCLIFTLKFTKFLFKLEFNQTSFSMAAINSEMIDYISLNFIYCCFVYTHFQLNPIRAHINPSKLYQQNIFCKLSENSFFVSFQQNYFCFKIIKNIYSFLLIIIQLKLLLNAQTQLNLSQFLPLLRKQNEIMLLIFYINKSNSNKNYLNCYLKLEKSVLNVITIKPKFKLISTFTLRVERKYMHVYYQYSIQISQIQTIITQTAIQNSRNQCQM
ncbi:hypothetical protein TTHERM_001102693 (macronuclear) [Tetrahymena thermophila SB210]|uniref:Uncharacterized protein n=1 Tax=Tetrahymena thermophila (strain SB210) TaxID=312017 RepID=W7XAV8_TETTS|nr:hypothetical protein TTHERM_001102693 [Tetrahymena thermophila SB210]EWS73558.1 hypothetical protein TTHERM_001102693 [Tetrahymena thermophila SB210]|eukprot:XP_012653907.1 hypothetical protein TTHERM_001102693 [Tetrahymena thermophila SB210]